jgi:tubulin polyglutamylase TTLL4
MAEHFQQEVMKPELGPDG